MAVGTVASKRGGAFVNICAILGEYFYSMGILAVAYSAVYAVVVALVCVVAGSALCILGNIILIRRKRGWFCNVMHRPVTYPARHACNVAVL